MDDQYDEFGNFIGEEPAEEEEDIQRGVDAAQYIYDDEPEDQLEQDVGMEVDATGLQEPSTSIILHEDKKYYPSAAQVYGEDVDIRVEVEDAQPLTEPIIAPIDTRKFNIQEDDLPPVFFERQFLSDLMSYPEHVRNVALAGHLHCGKTAFVDMLVMETHDIADRLERRTGKKRDDQLRYTDVHIIERERGLSTKAAPMSLVLQSTKGKSHLVNIMDTPGHINFLDEVTAALRMVDGLALVVDVVEGVQATTEKVIKHAVQQRIPITLVVNKFDRLILDLTLPPNDSYFKLKYVIEEVNKHISNACTTQAHAQAARVSPERGNVLFACADMGWCFTVQSFARMYANRYGAIDVDEFARRLWGDIYFNSEKRTFVRKPPREGVHRTFVQFILEPIYKIYSHTISDPPKQLRVTLEGLGIMLKPSQYKLNAKAMLKLVCEQFFGPCGGFVDMVVQHIPSPIEAAESILERYYTGPLDTKVVNYMKKCDQNGPLMMFVPKLYHTQNAKQFLSLARVLSGTARPGMQVRVLGQGYSIDDEEDMALATITDVFIAESRYNVPTDGIPAGVWALLGGIDNSIMKSATVVPLELEDSEDFHIFKPLAHMTESVFKVAVEPVNPSELPKMLDGLRKVNKSYPLVTTKVEESGEHIILGTGELYMDCVLHDLRRMFGDLDLKVSDPVTRFCETTVDTSATKCYAVTPNKKNKITMIAEPLDDGIAEDLEQGKVKITEPPRKIAKYFQEHYDWDLLAARSIWAFGPDDVGPNILVDDTLPSEVDKKLLGSVRETIKQGFSWATREGPLCEEPIRNMKFRLTDISLAQEALHRGGGQIIPTTRRACYSSFLMATPRVMEPLYSVSVVGDSAAVAATYESLARRRGHVLSETPIAGAPLQRATGLIPVIDSFGFETELRIAAKGKCDISIAFERWNVVPGDPLDKDVVLKPLQPAPPIALARDFVLKTRRRKGLSEDVGVGKFLEKEVLEDLLKEGLL